MKLLYTDIRHSLTKVLAREAERLAEAGKRVFYIAPNSLSFEKEFGRYWSGNADLSDLDRAR